MKDWNKLQADVDMILSKHYTSGRQGAKINKVVVHYNAGNLSIAGCYSVWQSRAASAHYQVEDGGRIGQLIHDKDTAWHASNWAANISSIGIEHANRSDGTISAACLDNGAHLVAAICKYYGLGRPQWLKNVFPHKYFAATSCPGQIYGSQKDAYMSRCQQWYDYMTGAGSQPSGSVNVGGGSTSTPSTPSKPSTGSSEHTGTGFGGTYTCMVDALNVRTAPSTSAATVAQYKKGQTVTLQDWYKIADGYVWGRYVGGSGNTRYVAVGKPTGGVAADDFLVKGGKVSGGSASSGFRRGAHTVTAAAGVNVRKGPGTNYAISGTLPKGYTINSFDGTTAQGSGYTWARYVNYNGYYRWIATKYLS